MNERRPLYVSMVASLLVHIIILLLFSLGVWHSNVGSWVTITDITVIGVSPLGEGLGQKPLLVPRAHPEGTRTEKTKVESKMDVVHLPGADRGPKMEEVAAVRSAFPIGSDTVFTAKPSTEVSLPEGYGNDPGRVGVPWGKAGVTGPLAQRAVRRQILPDYPAWAREKGIVARVEVGIRVTPEGQVRDEVAILKKSGFKELDELVVEAVKKWEFEPLPPVAKQEDQYGVVPIRFALTK